MTTERRVVYIRSDGTTNINFGPIGPQGRVAKLEFWLRDKGLKRIPNLLAKWDERKLGT